jgi:hypothetical protein
LAYIGQLDCYERGSEIAEVLMNVKTNDTSIYRITDKIGEQCEELTESESFRNPIELASEEYLIIESDGSMLFTREEGWKEVKLGRVFKTSVLLSETETRNWIKESEYIGHLGSHVEFESKMSKLIDEPYIKYGGGRLVFINDGAKWQWNWISAEYPEAIQILDYYHAMENIGKYVNERVAKKQVSTMMEKIAKALKEKGVPLMLTMLETIPPKTAAQKQKHETLMKYISNNEERMDYPQYIKQGLIIGSGAIESAHRTVLQRRMKQSGQRWSTKGLKNMINLRVINMSGYWNKIRELIKSAA